MIYATLQKFLGAVFCSDAMKHVTCLKRLKQQLRTWIRSHVREERTVEVLTGSQSGLCADFLSVCAQRLNHNMVEKQRRAKLRQLFDGLRREVGQNEEKMSKVFTLTKVRLRVLTFIHQQPLRSSSFPSENITLATFTSRIITTPAF